MPMIDYVSTRGRAPALGFEAVTLAGLAPDGGLYVPSKIERRPDAWWSALRGKSFLDIAYFKHAPILEGKNQ